MDRGILTQCLGEMKLDRVTMQKGDSQGVRLFCSSKNPVTASNITDVRNSLSKLLKLSPEQLELNVKLDLPDICENDIRQCLKEILKMSMEKYPSTIGLLRDAEIKIKDNHVYVMLKRKGAFLLKGECKKYTERLAEQMFEKKYLFEFEDSKEDHDYQEYLDRNESEILQIIEKMATVRTLESKSGAKNEEYAQKVILGTTITDLPVPMKDIDLETGKVTIQGKIFTVDFKMTKNEKCLFIFDLTDESFSFRAKCFVKKSQLETVEKGLKKGAVIRIRGELVNDTFAKEIVFMAKDINMAKQPFKTDDAQVKRVELHLHSKMSSMDGVTDMKEYLLRADMWGHTAMAVTDHGVVQSFPEAYSTVKGINKNREEPFKMIYGMEGYLIDENARKKRNCHIIILVKSQVGVKNLYKIVSESHLEHFHRVPRLPRQVIDKYREGLIIGSACEAGELFRSVIAGEEDERLMEIARYYDYLEIQPTGNNAFLIREGTAKDTGELENYNKKIVDIADRLNLPCVATCDVHFLEPNDEYYRRILMNSKGFSDADHQPPLYFRTTGEMLDEFLYLGEEKAYEVVVANTNKIADMIDTVSPIPDGTFPPVIDGAEDEVRNMSEMRARELYGDPLPDTVRKRMDKELNSIINNGFSVMYIIAQKLVHKSNEDGYLVGSRGSVGSSFIAFLMGITEVNPEVPHYRCTNSECLYNEFITDASFECGYDMPKKNCPKCGTPLVRDGYDIPFETFLGFEGDKEPDIDLNFSSEYQPRAHKYTEELFGEGKVFRAGTIGSVAEKTAYGYVLKYEEERGVMMNNSEKLRLAMGCEGVKRTTSQHPGGIMIIPHDKEVYDFTPVQYPADDTNSQTITTHFDYNFLHGSILKLDILGHVDPTAIRMLESLTGIDAKTIEMGEEKTMSLFSSTKALDVDEKEINSTVGVLGIPEFGTGFVRQMLVETKPTAFSELIRISGLSHGTDVWTNNAQNLINEKICTLKEAICLRDDIMLFLIHSGLPPKNAFFIMEKVRKGKGLSEEDEKLMKEKGVPGWYIQSCKTIKYMFPKAHAAAYVMMAFRIAWFKVYYPKEFYTTYFSTRAGEFDAMLMTKGADLAKDTIRQIKAKGYGATAKEKNMITILEVVVEMYARGIRFLNIDVYHSDAVKFTIEENNIRPPLNSLQGLGDTAAFRIAEARADGIFISQENLKQRTGISKAIVDNLISSNAISALPESSQITFYE